MSCKTFNEHLYFYSALVRGWIAMNTATSPMLPRWAKFSFMTHWKHNKKVENEGILHVAKVINDQGCIFNKIDGSNDIGLDGFVEFVEAEKATGLCIGVQIKSGQSFQSQNKVFAVIRADKSHFEYWKNFILPIAGIVYVPDDGKAYWIDITEHLNNNPLLVESGSYNLSVEKTAIFNADSFSDFYNHFAIYKKSFTEDWNLARSLKGIVDFKPFHVREASLKSLFYFHRDCKETWYYLLQQFKIEEDEPFQLHLISIMRFLIGHGDTYWHKNNFIPDEIVDYARDFIKKYYGFHEVDKLLKFIGEGGITRGTIGQDVYPLIHIIPDKLQILERIISDNTRPEINRYWATVIAINHLQYKNSLEAIAFIDKVKKDFLDTESLEMLEAIREIINSEGFFDIYG